MYDGERVTLQSLVSQRCEEFWKITNSLLDIQKLAIIGSETPENYRFLKDKKNCLFVSNLKGSLKEAKEIGFSISTSLNQFYSLIILEITKSREQNFALMSWAEEHMCEGSAMIINGDNGLGIKSFLNKISQYWSNEKMLIKKKGRIALYLKKKVYFCIGGTFRNFD